MFNHKITENQRNDPVLTEEIGNKLQKILTLKKSRSNDNKLTKEESVVVPKVVLEQIYQLLDERKCF